MYDSADLKKGVKLEINGDPYIITNFDFVKPGKGRSLYKCKLKNMITGIQFDRTFRSGDKFKEANIEAIEMEYIYFENDSYCFMNSLTYEQIFMSGSQIGQSIAFLKYNTICNILLFNEKPVGISLPNFVDLKVEASEPWAKGDTATGSNKNVRIETGYLVQVPPFINDGQIIRIDTRTGQYVERISFNDKSF